MPNFRYPENQNFGDILLGDYGEWDLYTDRNKQYALICNKEIEHVLYAQAFPKEAPYTAEEDPQIWEAFLKCKELYDVFVMPDPSVSPYAKL